MKKHKRCKKLGQYVCPHNHSVPTVPALIDLDKGSNSTVYGKYCKNNCSLYKNNKCELFKR